MSARGSHLTRRHLKRAAQSAYQWVPFKRQLAMALRPLPLPRPVQRLIRFDGVITVAIDPAHSFQLTAGRLANELFWRGYGRGWEATSLRVWASAVPHANTIVDIGGNVGIYALAAKTLAPRAHVVAFEPLERMHRRLVENVRLNGFEIDAEQLAVSDRTGVATLYDAQPDDFSVASLDHAPQGKGKVVPHEVPVTRLDDYCADHGIDAIDLLKIDIEGHEPAALRGMGEQLSRGRPTILIEVLSNEAANEVWSLLKPLDYEAYRIDERRGIERVDGMAGQSDAGRNYLVCQPGVAARYDLESLMIAKAVRQ